MRASGGENGIMLVKSEWGLGSPVLDFTA